MFAQWHPTSLIHGSEWPWVTCSHQIDEHAEEIVQVTRHFWLECMGDVGVPAQRGSQLATTNQLLWLFYVPASHVWFIFCVEQCCTLQTVMWDTPTHTYTHQHPYTETSNYWYIASLYVAMYMCVLCLWMVSHASNYSLVQQKHFSFGQTKVLPMYAEATKQLIFCAKHTWGSMRVLHANLLTPHLLRPCSSLKSDAQSSVSLRKRVLYAN